MQLTPQQVQQVKDGVQKIVKGTLERAKKNEAEDVAEYLTLQIIDRIEWSAPTPELQKPLASMVLQAHKWPMGVEGSLKKYFSLTY